MKFRKKPVVIDAIRFWNGNGPSTISEVLSFTGDKGEWIEEEEKMLIHTLEGDHLASDGDWIIKGVKGEFYPIKPDIFEMTYEAVDSQSSQHKEREDMK